MARPVSWLPRLHEIRRTVAKSELLYYDRSRVESLFGVQPRAAQKLMELLPSVRVGTARLVERDALMHFLERIHAADDVAAAMDDQRRDAAKPVRRKLHHIVRTDRPTATLDSLPSNLTLEPGRLEVRFSSLEEMAEVLFSVAQLLEFEGDEFARRYERRPERGVDPDLLEVQRMFALLQE